MKETLNDFHERYFLAFQDYLEGVGEGALGRGYELGRQAVSSDIGVLDLVAIYKEAVRKTLPGNLRPEEVDRILKGAEFFLESLSSFEITHRAFRDSNAGLRRMNQMLEEETRRITHVLHDEAGQLLAATYLALKEVECQVPLHFQEGFQKIRNLLQLSEQHLRRLVHEVRPTVLDDLGLLPALEFLARGVSKRSGLVIPVKGLLQGRLQPLVETLIYRIVREALTNVVRHACAKEVVIRVYQEDQGIQCSIQDDGIGMKETTLSDCEEEKGLGLTGIRELLKSYGGTLKIQSMSGQGTGLFIFIPREARNGSGYSPSR
ncbi:MAG: ATP-binding protein [Nitrospirae bacterium]|nr:ATP-binding protein [Nitrospirota bacterium]MBI3593720.1 ATP-binding protein [Nitrospirota bacterium]